MASPIFFYLLFFSVLTLSYLAYFRAEKIIGILLVHFKGQKNIDGPAWQWNNGQMVEKFLMGYEKSRQWSEAYGSIYRIWAGLTPEIVITTPQQVRTFHSDGLQHRKSNGSNAGWMFHGILGDCLGFLNGEAWRELRIPFERAFNRESAATRVMETIEFANTHVQQMKSWLRNQQVGVMSDVKSTMSEKENQKSSTHRMGVVEAFQRFPFFHSARVIYGSMGEHEEAELWQLGPRRQALLRFVIQGGKYRFRGLKWFARDAVQEHGSFQTSWRKFNQEQFDRRRARPEGSLIETLWPLVRDGKLQEKEVLQTFDEILFANLDVTTHVISWFFTLLADDTSVQQKLRMEIQKNKADPGSYLLKTDTYLHHCLLESLRVRPVSAFTIPESSTADKMIDGVKIPAGVDVVVDAVAINIRNPFWGKDSTVFRPERFEGLSAADLRYNLSDFGFGARKCLGRYEAMVLIKALAVKTIEAFQISIYGADKPQGESERKFQVLRDNWIPIADVELTFEEIS